MNSFCECCTGNNKREIKECDDRYCPFYRFRFADMDWQVDKKKLDYNKIMSLNIDNALIETFNNQSKK